MNITPAFENPNAAILECLAKGFEDLAKSEAVVMTVRKSMGEPVAEQVGKFQAYTNAAALVRGAK